MKRFSTPLTYIHAGLHLPQNYYHSIPAAPELGQSRKVDISRLRDIRKRLDTGHISTKELEVIAIECVDELVELCSGKVLPASLIAAPINCGGYY